MSYYEDIVMQTQMVYSRYYNIYASGKTPYPLSDRPPLPYGKQMERLVQEIRSADCVVVGGASGLSAAGGGEAFPWVRGYGNFLQGEKYEHQYEKISRYLLEHKDKSILFLELGVGRLTPMFIQEPFWILTMTYPKARYIAVNDRYGFLPKQIEDKGNV